MTAPDALFERLRERLEQQPPAPSAEDRELVWADPGHLLALARDDRGQVEIFVVGPPLTASTRVVAANLVHHTWRTSDGSTFDASRVVLPGEPHFDGVATLVCAELLRNGVDRSPQAAFAQVEPVIALALRRAVLGDEVLAGLVGELVVLDRILRVTAPRAAAEVVAGWYGHDRSTRDIQLRGVGVEVKTTTGPRSIHSVSGVRQVELGRAVDGRPESALYLASVGVTWLDEDVAGLTLPGLVDSILNHLEAAHVGPEDVAELLKRVMHYGGDAGLGYDHAHHNLYPRFLRPFELRFERLYDLTDEKVHVLTSKHLEGLDHVEVESVGYTIVLPDRLRGDVNPVAGLHAVATTIARRAGLPLRAA
ncbi:PD-(D/E)XK motif protein [Cellulomonas uda]|uniref:PD-(D/E)XK motif protein n=1 Tax=Cellulomonas uda TaxID=1714 RepID=A0A4Y3KFU3_CELUD|nr:PD-(D/E)XK motif protein [Cellulomonas uda]NII66256.1 hypothetical protein [Cellulomonas uda]GEA81935.1 hypothetical protein CUD01_23790 [Cellulomonas uda]